MAQTQNSASPAQVREWARQNGFTVGDRGKFSDELQKAYNRANGLKYRPGQHVATQRVSAKPPKGRTVTRSVSLPAVREWAQNAGLEVGARGRIPQDILEAYVLNMATAERNARAAATPESEATEGE